ncbi:MAG: DUF4367 domain-containing protein, partial [Oscillospiraceae bacterium]
DDEPDALLIAAACELAARQEREAELLFAQIEARELPAPSQRHLDAIAAIAAGRRSPRRQVRKTVLRWAACLAVVLGVSGVLFPAQVGALMEYVTRFVFARYDTHTEIRMAGGAPSRKYIEEFVVLRPTWLPDGYVQSETQEHRMSSMTCYQNEGRELILTQNTASATAAVDTEDAATEQTQVAGMEALYIDKPSRDHKMLVFHDDTYLFILSGGGLTREDLFRVAESIVPADYYEGS